MHLNSLHRSSWQSKIRELLPYVACHHVVCAQTENDYFADAKILITSYNLMERMNDKILKRGFGFVIFVSCTVIWFPHNNNSKKFCPSQDESHLLKNSKAKVTEVAQKLAAQAKRAVLLTGTPAMSRPLELFTQLQMIDDSIFTYRNYSRRIWALISFQIQKHFLHSDSLLCRKTNEIRMGCNGSVQFEWVEFNFVPKIYDTSNEAGCANGTGR